MTINELNTKLEQNKNYYTFRIDMVDKELARTDITEEVRTSLEKQKAFLIEDMQLKEYRINEQYSDNV